MKIRRSLAAAVFLATAAAPVAMGAAPAFADTAPAGHEQTDPAETKAAETKADEAKTDEANRAAIEKLLVYPNDYLLTDPSAYLREHAAAALAGTPADRAHFLAVEVDGIRRDDARIAIARIMNAAGPVLKKQCRALVDSDDVEALRAFLKTGQYVARAEDEKRAAEDDDRLRLSQIMSAGGPAVRKAAGAALDGSIEDVRAFLKTGQYVARAEDENRAEVQRLLDDPNSGPVVREAAQKALAGSAADVEHFLKAGLKNAAETDDRIRTTRIMSAGGPAVRKAANAALSGSIEDIRTFLKTGQYVARAEDENRAEVQRILDDPNSGPVVREAAQKALAGSAADVEHFLKEGQFTARAADKAAAEAARGTSGSAQPGTTVVPAAATAGGTAPAAAADVRTVGEDSLASTGPTTPLGQLAAAGGAAVLLGAGALVAARRRPQA